MLGPGDYEESLEASLPPGTRTFQAEISSSGHMMLPCATYKGGTSYTDDQGLKLYPELKLPVCAEQTEYLESRQTEERPSEASPKKVSLFEELLE